MFLLLLLDNYHWNRCPCKGRKKSHLCDSPRLRGAVCAIFNQKSRNTLCLSIILHIQVCWYRSVWWFGDQVVWLKIALYIFEHMNYYQGQGSHWYSSAGLSLKLKKKKKVNQKATLEIILAYTSNQGAEVTIRSCCLPGKHVLLCLLCLSL